MHPTPYDTAKSIFTNAKNTDSLSAHAFSTWRNQASLQDWNQLELAWQTSERPPSFSWDVLEKVVVAWSVSLCSPCLPTLHAFLYPPINTRVDNDGWLDQQPQSVKRAMFRTAQQWMEKSTFDLDEQAGMLLRLAIDCGCMDLWRQAPEACVEHIDWYSAMGILNGCSPDVLTVADIERIPLNNVPTNTRPAVDSEHVNTMTKCCMSNWRMVARCLEDHAGPGLWVQYVLAGRSGNLEEARRNFAWDNMRLDGLDAWALTQWHTPSSSFEHVFEGQRAYERGFARSVAEHKEWAHQWWLSCVLGMDSGQALDLARNIKTVVRTPDTFDLDTAIFEANSDLKV